MIYLGMYSCIGETWRSSSIPSK